MNHLQEKRLALELTQPQVSARLKEVEPRADVGMVSRYEKGVCLPTGPQLSVLEELYGAARTELYDAEDLDLSQPDVVRLLRPRCPIMDVSLYSKIENGHCLPNKETMKALEAALQAPVSVLFEPDELAALPDDEGQEKALCVNPYYAMLATAIPYGRRNAITRQALAAKLGMNDRAARKAIEEARAAGLLIMCEQNGRGYYQSDDPVEMRCQYQQDTNRAMSILKRRKPLRDALKAAGQRV
jgi:transcriptional regulator with XRE-family HTH domain